MTFKVLLLISSHFAGGFPKWSQNEEQKERGGGDKQEEEGEHPGGKSQPEAEQEAAAHRPN